MGELPPPVADIRSKQNAAVRIKVRSGEAALRRRESSPTAA